MRIAFLGGGNMATALFGGMIAAGSPPDRFTIVEPYAEQRARLAQRFARIDLHERVSAAALRDVGLVVLAVKPQQMREALAPLASLALDVDAVLSVAAGIRIADLARWLGGFDRIMRAMPNTPALIRAGITGLHVPAGVPDRAVELATNLLAAVGDVVRVDDEAMLDAVTGVSASGPAYVFYFLEALERGARDLGFSPADARKLAYATFEGAVRLAVASDVDAATLRAQVTSKGGTTERGIAALERAQVAEAIVRAAKAATDRAAEMADAFGSDPSREEPR